MARLLFPVTAVLALATFVSAQSMVSAQSSASIFIVNADPQPLVGSIVGTDGPATTYQIQCSAGTDSEECGIPGPFTYIKDGTSSIQYAIGLEGVTATIKCSVEGTVSAVCTASGDVPPSDSGAPAEAVDVTTTLLADEFQYTQIPITGGIAATAAPPTRTPSTAASTSPSTQQASMTARQTSSQTGSTSSQTGSTSSQTGSTSSQTGSTSSQTGSTSSQTGSTSSQSSPSSGQAKSTGTTGSATSLDRSSMIALVGAAALAAVLI